MPIASEPVAGLASGIFNPSAGEAIFRLDTLDYTILGIYFGVLLVMSLFGLRKYYYIYLYRKNRNVYFEPAARFEELPVVTVQLPMYNEKYVGARLLESVCQFDYPKDRLHIQVLDDSTDDTVEIMHKATLFWRERGFDVDYVHRTDRTGFKAGALENGNRTAKGGIVAIFDADFLPPSDFLQKTVHYFTDPRVAIVQTRWGHINARQSLLTRVQAIFLDGHFMMESFPRSRGGKFVNFNGTAGLWRKCAIDDAGGWQHDTITEDLDLSLRAQLKGWKYVYLPEIETPAELPAEMNAYKNQQNRWAKGSTQVCLKLLPTILRAPIPRHVKTEAFFHLASNFVYPLMTVLALLLLPAMIVRANAGEHLKYLMDVPIFLASTLSVVLFYVESQKALYRDWKKRSLLLPFLMAVGIGISVTNGKAVIEAIFGYRNEFVRTPKYSLSENGGRDWRRRVRTYRGKIGVWPLVEIGLGAFFLYVLGYSLSIGCWMVLPFLTLFIVGYFYTGFGSLLHGLLKFDFVNVQWRRIRSRMGEEA